MSEKVLPWQLCNKLWCAGLVRCRVTAYNKAQGMKTEEEWNLMYDLFHGTNISDFIYYTPLLTTGQPLFDDIL